MRVSSATINPRDLTAVQSSLEVLPELSRSLVSGKSPYLAALSVVPESLASLCRTISGAISVEAPREITEGSIFVPGYSAELDEIRDFWRRQAVD